MAISLEEMYHELRETDLGMKGFHEQQSTKEKLRSETTLCSDMMQGIACINVFSFAEVQLSLSPSKLAITLRTEGALQWLCP